MHAAAAAVNVNFWITPNEANRNPESGGLVVWDKEAPDGWTLLHIITIKINIKFRNF